MSLRTGLAIVGALVVIYVVARVGSFAAGPVGKAASGLLGAAGSILAAFASLPTWLLVGLAFAYLLGPAVLKLAGADALALGRGLRAAAAKVGDAVRGGATPEEAKAMAEAAVSKAAQNMRDNVAGREGASADALAQAEQAAEARATVRAANVEAGQAEADARGEEIGDEVVPVDGLGRRHAVWRQRALVGRLLQSTVAHPGALHRINAGPHVRAHALAWACLNDVQEFPMNRLENEAWRSSTKRGIKLSELSEPELVEFWLEAYGLGTFHPKPAGSSSPPRASDYPALERAAAQGLRGPPPPSFYGVTDVDVLVLGGLAKQRAGM